MNSHYLLSLLLGLVLLSTSCHTDYKPTVSETSARSIPSDSEQIEIARKAWIILSDKDREKEWPAAMERYNNATRIVFQRIRQERFMAKENFNAQKERPFVIKRAIHPDDRNPGIYEDCIPCDMISVRAQMEERVFVKGLGLPIAGVVRKTNGSDSSSHTDVLKDKGHIHTLTVIFDFGQNPSAKPVLRVIPRLGKESVKTGTIDQPLAGDFTAPLALFWERNKLSDTALLGAFRPKKTINYSGLYFSEPYDPDKIPVLLTHGLMSSPDTFSNLVNRLLVDPEIRKNYQFWYFSYPSGTLWTLSAKKLRLAIDAVAQEYDPKGTSKTLNNMVMVGHSMGGLITRYNNATQPWNMIPQFIKNQEDLKSMNYNQVKNKLIVNQETTKIMQNSFVFQPCKQTSRIIFMATPHKGSSFADTWIGMIGEHLIRLPENLFIEATKIITLSSDMLLLNPKNIEREFTSIRQLSPSSSLIRGIQTMTPKDNIPVHSVIGNKRLNPLFRSTDGVVPYWSSHLDWSKSEKIIRSGHSVHDTIGAALEMRAILHEHLRGLKLKNTERTLAPTIWQTIPPKEVYLPWYGYIGK